MIAGNIKSGKSALCQLLAAKNPGFTLMEDHYTLSNRYLPLFINYMKKNGFEYNPFAYATQVLFLQNRVRREMSCRDTATTYILDRSIYEDRHIYTRVFYQLGIMNKEEYDDFKNIFEKILRNLPQPKCLVLLETDPSTIHTKLHNSEEWKHLSWMTKEFLEEMEKAYRGVLAERMLLINPSINIIRVNWQDYDSNSSLAEDIHKKLSEYFPELLKQRSLIN